MLSPCRAARDLLPIARVGRAPGASPSEPDPLRLPAFPMPELCACKRERLSMPPCSRIFYGWQDWADFRLNYIFTECGVFTYNI